jgi:hypothetical protein
MSRHLATPGEFEQFMAQLEPVPADRRSAIARMNFEQMAECPICGEPVRRRDRRDLIDGGLAHLLCTRREITPEPSGEQLQNAKRQERDKLEAMRAAAAGRIRERELRLRQTDGNRDHEAPKEGLVGKGA